MVITLIATVIMKRIANTNATFRSFFLLMKILVLLREDDNISEAIRSSIAVIASQRLISQRERGNRIFIVHSVCF